MPSRTFHHKSRHGCFNCKQRRKRCDERRPKCSACARRRSDCNYDYSAEFGGNVNNFQRSIIRSLATEWATLDPSVQALLSLQVPHVGFEDVEMIYHFKTVGPSALDTMPGIFGVRHLNLVQRARDYPYLLYGLITAAALHLKCNVMPGNESSRLSLEAKATHSYQLALSDYRSRLNFINEQTCHSIFAFSVTLAGLTFGSLLPGGPRCCNNYQVYMQGIIDIFELLLGAVAVANASRAWIPESLAEEPLLLPIRAPLDPQCYSTDGEAYRVLSRLPSEIYAAHVLECSRDGSDIVEDISVIYDSAIPELHNVFSCLQRSEPNDILGAVGWSAFAGRPFLTLLKAHHPAALVVLAHYGVALQALSHVWWLQGVGSRVIRAVVKVMASQCNEDWQKLLRWPLEKLEQPQLYVTTTRAVQVCSAPGLNKLHDSPDVRSFETALVITQVKGITGPYNTTSNRT